MAVYQRLNLGAEGGIIDPVYQAEQKNCVVLCVGLGGIGCDCINNIKAKIYERIKPDNAVNEYSIPVTPDYSSIKFLAIDSDTRSILDRTEQSAYGSRLRKEEFLDISSSERYWSLVNDKDALVNDPSFNNWFNRDCLDPYSSIPCRQIGRLLLFLKADILVRRIQDLLSEAMSGRKYPMVYINVFSGTGGTTGSGSFLDVCYLAREALKRAEISAAVLGYCFLPDVNIARGLSPQDTANVQVNGYASISELDYCMNFQNNGDSWNQEYPGVGLVTSSKPPVDICHLISANDKDGNVITDGYNYAMNVVTEYFMDYVVNTSDLFSLSSHISNFDAKKRMVTKNSGASYEYMVIGAATATIPFKQVLTYLASGMFSKMNGLANNYPEANSVDRFMKQNQLEFEAIVKKLTNKCNATFSAEDNKWKDAKNNPQLTVPHFEEEFAKFKERLSANASALSRDLETYVVSADGTQAEVRSLIAVINEKLQDMAVDPEYGPIYASALLQSTTGTDLIAKVAGLKAKAEELYDHYLYQETRSGGLYDTYKKTEGEFQSANGFNGSSKYKTFVNSVQNLFKNRAYTETYRAMIEIMKKLDEQIHALSDKFMAPFRDVVNNLYDTFKENYKYIEGILTGSITTHSYEIPIATISDMKPQLDQTLEDMDIKEKYKELMKKLLSEEGVKAWTSGNENEVCVVVNVFFTKLFHEYSNMTINKYLEQKFGVTSAPELIKKIEEEIVNQLYAKANPRYWVSNTYQISTASPLGYVTYPESSAEIGQASQNLAGNCQQGELTSRPSDIKDRISVLRCLVGIPMYGYQGISQYETKSVSSVSVGRHLYEGSNYIDGNGKNRDGKDWRYLPSPTPLTLMNSTNSSILYENAQKAAALYRKAVDLGIIYYPEDKPLEFYFRTVTDDYISNISAIRDKNIRRSKSDRINAVAEIERLKKNKQYNPELIKINNEATSTLGPVQREEVRIDHFVKTPVIQSKVRKEVERLEAIDAIIEELRPKEDTDLATFQQGILSGVISYSRETRVIVYEYGYEERIVLSEPPMSPIAKGIPLFYALKSFREMDAVIKDEIKEKAEALLNQFPVPDAVKEGFKVIEADMANAQSYITLANARFPEETNSLKEFLKATTEFVEVERIELGF